MVSLGIDIGGTSVKVASVAGDGRVLWTGKSQPFARPDTAQIINAIRQATEGHDTTADAIGLCCPGLLDRSRRVITLSVNVPGLVDVPLDELVARAVGAGRPPAAILSDASAVGYDIFIGRQMTDRLLCLTGGVGIRLKPLVGEIKARVQKDLTRVARTGWTLTTGESDYHAACGVARYAAAGHGH